MKEKILSEIIYLDPSFITESYEQFTGEPVPVQVSKSSNYSGELSGWFVTAGATMTVERQYPVSIQRMYEVLSPKFKGFPNINLEDTRPSELPELFWVQGVFGMSRSGLQQGGKELDSSSFFSFCPSLSGDRKRDMPLTTNDAYFTAGYDQLSRHAYSMACDFAIQASLLVKLLYLDRFYPVCALMVGVKNSHASEKISASA